MKKTQNFAILHCRTRIKPQNTTILKMVFTDRRRIIYPNLFLISSKRRRAGSLEEEACRQRGGGGLLKRRRKRFKIQGLRGPYEDRSKMLLATMKPLRLHLASERAEFYFSWRPQDLAGLWPIRIMRHLLPRRRGKVNSRGQLATKVAAYVTCAEKQPSQAGCVSEDLKCWGAWDTTNLRAQSQGHHTIDRLEEDRRV